MNAKAKPATTMHIAWNALTDAPASAAPVPETALDAYHVACAKYSNEIRVIQKYFPGWKPAFGGLMDDIEAAM